MKLIAPSFKLATLNSSLLLAFMALSTNNIYGANNAYLSFEGLSLPAIAVDVPSNTGLDMLYVCYDISNSTVKFPTQNPQTKWYIYSNLGGGYAEEITQGIGYENGFSTLQNPQGDMGYIIEDGDSRSYFWIVEYKGKRLTLHSAQAASDQDCDYSVIDVDGSGEPIHYFTINGQQKVLSRDIEVAYQTLNFDSESLQYIQGEVTKSFESLTPELRLSPPAYCQTEFTISGDRFLKEWNWMEEITTDVVSPHAVEVHTEAIQESMGSEDSQEKIRRKRLGKGKIRSRAEGDNPTEPDQSEDPGLGEDNPTDNTPGSNIISGGSGGLGGSAPAEISFRAYVTDGVLHNEWQMSSNQDFDPVDYRFTQQDLDYTFNEEGTFYLRFIGSNSDGSCESIGDVYTVTIGASELKIPNAFSPNGDGINDIWKVAFRSLTKFDCWIFDRYGNEIYSFSDPTGGWDGKKGGKDVKPGVYYYVIEAEGADGKKYKKSGDINILRYVGGVKSEVPAE